MLLRRARHLRAFDRGEVTTVLADDGRALRFEGDSAALVRALLASAANARTRSSLLDEIGRLAGAPVDPSGPVGEAIEMLRGAGALVEVDAAHVAPRRGPVGGADAEPANADRRRRVLLTISGAVAAAFAPLLVQLLLERGHHVRCAASKKALRFVSATALEALTHERVVDSMWSNAPDAPVNHIALARWAEIVLVHPATATTIGRIAQGDCSKLVSAVAISTRAPVLVVPAMNDAMFTAPSVARNLERLVADGMHVAHVGLGFEVADAPHARRPMLGAPPPVESVAALVDAVLAEHPRAAPSAAFWDEAYATTDPDALPWATRELDADVAPVLERLLATGARLLDVGAGTGSAAIAAARLGFSVVATDVSPRALDLARDRARGLAVTFLVDDVTATRLVTRFDVVLDRGCLHTLDEVGRRAYAGAMRELVRPGGTLVVKTHSVAEPVDRGTHRFEKAELVGLFEGFTAERVEDTTFTGPLGDTRALLAVLRRA